MSYKKKSLIITIIMIAVYLMISVVVVHCVKNNGVYPTGSDTYYHIYRGDYVYQSIQNHNWYPLWNPMWYNGVELLRYWAPLTAYFMALCQLIMQGDPMQGYLLFVGAMSFLGAIPWLLIGTWKKRPILGAFIGIIWFFMPNNLTALFVEGNLARSLCMVFLPFFVYALNEYLNEKEKKHLIMITLSFAFMILCHLGYAGMIALAALLYLGIRRIVTRQKGGALECIAAILIGFLLLGIWLYPSLRGGITSMDSSENMKNFFQDAWLTINPVYRMEMGFETFYFGMAAFILSVFGSLFSHRKTRAGFLCSFIIYVCTTTAMYPILKVLPGSQYLWILRFISIALCMLLYAFLSWDTLKKPFLVICCILLVLDIMPSMPLIYGNQSGESPKERLDVIWDATLIHKAQEITSQRMALLDESTLGSQGAYLVSDWGQPTASAFGAGWEAANTSVNIAQLNKALSKGKYMYMFDRCVNLGNDTVLIKMSQTSNIDNAVEKMDAAAEASGYQLIEQNDSYRLYHLDVTGNWGVKTQYEALGIGTASAEIALDFPSMEEGQSNYVDDYTYEELSAYRMIYLSGFWYHDCEKAENLLTKLSENGVRICIMADGIPIQQRTHEQIFLGVHCNEIMFSNGYPDLNMDGTTISTELFPGDYAEWSTVYMENLDKEWGYLYDNNLELSFCGTVKNDNIVFLGLNLSKFYGLTGDAQAEKILEKVFSISANKLPNREMIPLTITYEKNTLEIVSTEDDVNTTFAYHDIFEGNQEITSRERLLQVQKGTTSIHMKYPYFRVGMIISIAGVLLLIGIGRKRGVLNDENGSNVETAVDSDSST